MFCKPQVLKKLGSHKMEGPHCPVEVQKPTIGGEFAPTRKTTRAGITFSKPKIKRYKKRHRNDKLREINE